MNLLEPFDTISATLTSKTNNHRYKFPPHRFNPKKLLPKHALSSYIIPSSSFKRFRDTGTSNLIFFVPFCSSPSTEIVEQVILPGCKLSNHWLAVPLVRVPNRILQSRNPYPKFRTIPQSLWFFLHPTSRETFNPESRPDFALKSRIPRLK